MSAGKRPTDVQTWDPERYARRAGFAPELEDAHGRWSADNVRLRVQAVRD